MKKLSVIASLASLIAASSALAADLPSRKMAPAAPVAPAFTWTGFYAGINAGVNWSSRNVNYSIYGTNPAIVDLSPADAAALSPLPYGNSRAGFIGGIQVGYNYQINQFVIGAEADFMGMAVSKRSSIVHNATLSLGNAYTNAVSTNVEQNWLGTVRARAGFAANKALFYVTGGFAYGNAKTATNSVVTETVGDFSAGWAGSRDETKAGYVIGAGIEYAITNNWIIRGEYLYYNLGTASSTAAGTTLTNNGQTGLNDLNLAGRTKTTIDGNIIRAAVSYKF